MVDIIQRSPTPSEYNSLRQSVGWPTFQEELITMGMSKTIYSIIAVDESGIVGMGRIIGDGAIYFHIQDVVIRPDYQGAGVGKLIMD